MKKKLCLLMALVCCVAVFAVAFAACNDGGKGGSGNGGVFSSDMSYDEFFNTITSMENWTETMEIAQAYGDAEPVLTQKFTFKWDGEEFSSEYYDDYQANELRRSYGFTEDGVSYQIDERNYDFDDDYNAVVTDEFSVYEAEKALSPYYLWLWKEEITADATEYSPMLAGYVGREFVALESSMTYVMLGVTERDGKIVYSGLWDPDPDYEIDGMYEGYLEFRGNGIVVGYRWDYMDEGERYRGYAEFSVKDVGVTDAEVPDRIRAMKGECEWVESVSIGNVRYDKPEDVDFYFADVHISAYNLNEHGVTVYEVLPEVNGLPVTGVSIRVDNYYGVVDVSRVEVRVWFDRDGNYQGEYADLPKLELGEFWNQSNVPVKYYGEW